MTTVQEQSAKLIDQLHDFATHVLDVQRDIAQQILALSTAAVEKVRSSTPAQNS